MGKEGKQKLARCVQCRDWRHAAPPQSTPPRKSRLPGAGELRHAVPAARPLTAAAATADAPTPTRRVAGSATQAAPDAPSSSARGSVRGSDTLITRQSESTRRNLALVVLARAEHPWTLLRRRHDDKVAPGTGAQGLQLAAAAERRQAQRRSTRIKTLVCLSPSSLAAWQGVEIDRMEAEIRSSKYLVERRWWNTGIGGAGMPAAGHASHKRLVHGGHSSHAVWFQRKKNKRGEIKGKQV